jgi:hypothetical protein
MAGEGIMKKTQGNERMKQREKKKTSQKDEND